MNGTDTQSKDERTAGRERVFMSGTIVSPSGSHRVRVRDLSRSGCQIWSEDVIPSGVDAIFSRAGVFVAARVVWSDGYEAGIKFYREIEDF